MNLKIIDVFDRENDFVEVFDIAQRFVEVFERLAIFPPPKLFSLLFNDGVNSGSLTYNDGVDSGLLIIS